MSTRARADQRGFGSTAKTVETLQQDRPLARAKLAADQATLAPIRC